MEKKKRKALIILSVIVALTLAFIWIHSSMGKEESSDESNFIYQLLCPFFEVFMGKGNVTEHFIRKLAHFTEFCGLGLELMLLMRLALVKVKRIIRLTNAWVLGTMCALIDETIQIFSGRGPMVADVWLDSAGCMTGVLVMTAGIWIWERRNASKEKIVEK